jgi:hypothetical protein
LAGQSETAQALITWAVACLVCPASWRMAGRKVETYE